MESQPPKPIEMGNALTQVAGPANEGPPAVLIPLPPSVANTLQTLAADQPRALGNPAMAQMVASLVLTQDQRLTSALEEVRQGHHKLEAAKTEISNLRVQAGILRSQLSTQERAAHARGILSLVGGTLIGIGIDLYKDGGVTENRGLILACAGVALLVVASWTRLTKKESP